jgi:hypothetical protein
MGERILDTGAQAIAHPASLRRGSPSVFAP